MLACKSYVSLSSLGDATRCRDQLRIISETLDAWLDAGGIAGYRCEVFETEAALEEDAVHPAAIKKRATGRFPCVWLNVTWSSTAPAGLAALVSTHDLEAI